MKDKGCVEMRADCNKKICATLKVSSEISYEYFILLSHSFYTYKTVVDSSLGCSYCYTNRSFRDCLDSARLQNILKLEGGYHRYNNRMGSNHGYNYLYTSGSIDLSVSFVSQCTNTSLYWIQLLYLL